MLTALAAFKKLLAIAWFAVAFSGCWFFDGSGSGLLSEKFSLNDSRELIGD